jgi:hypothetical protein
MPDKSSRGECGAAGSTAGAGALGLADTTDHASQTESDVPGLRAAMADRDAKVEEIRRKVMGLKVQLLECCRR